MTIALHAAGLLSHHNMEEEGTWNEALKLFAERIDKGELGKCFMTWFGIWAKTKLGITHK